MRATQKFGEHEQASTRLNFASKSNKGKILRAVKNLNGPFITPNKFTNRALTGLRYSTKRNETIGIRRNEVKMKITGVSSSRYEFVM